MNKKIKLIVIFVLVVCGFAGLKIFYDQNKNNVEVADVPEQEEVIPAIDFKAHDKDGKNVYLSDFNDGKVIIVNFWATTCPYCVEELPDFQKMCDTYKDDVHFVMVDIVGFSGETKEMAKAFIEENGYSFNVVYDDSNEAAVTYGINSLPATLVINKNFEIYGGWVGMLSEEMLSPIIEELINQKKIELMER